MSESKNFGAWNQDKSMKVGTIAQASQVSPTAAGLASMRGGNMKNNSVHFSSKTDMWSTPDDFYRKLHQEFNFKTDVCSTHENAKCENHFTIDDDGLTKEWKGFAG